MKSGKTYSKQVLFNKKRQRIFRGEKLLQIAMPLGGIGSGCICLNGHGGLQDFSIRNRPAFSALDEASVPMNAAFAIIHIKNTDLTRLVEGPLPVEKIYNLGIKAQGNQQGGYEGLPRFRNCSFRGEFPFGFTELSDPMMPISINITGFNPFIPLDDKNSSLPCSILEYTLKNISNQPVEFQFSYHLSHFAPGGKTNRDQSYTNSSPVGCSRNEVIPQSGIYFYNDDFPDAESFGSSALGIIGYEPKIKAMWFRGGWFDAISAIWREVSLEQFQQNDGSNSSSVKGRNGGSILVENILGPGESITFPIVITWYFPNVYYEAGGEQVKNLGVFTAAAIRETTKPAWHPYYVSQWRDARDVFCYVKDHYGELRNRTQAFHDALFSSTLPWYVLDAVSANLAILKSPTVLRDENGNIWGWEGCFCQKGCCFGSCTHVWNYAQSLPHLFPKLERGLRELELIQSIDEAGHTNFRSALPVGRTHHNFHAAADGQLGGIIKLYREWQISGNLEWLKKLFPAAKRSIDYAISTWDPQKKGVIEEPHHNTYDIEFWGPDGMHASIYFTALSAMSIIARQCGYLEDAKYYEDLAMKGIKFVDNELWNREYYEQKVCFKGLKDQSFANYVKSITDENPQEDQIQRKEGPKYQYGSGCLSDGVIGAWFARCCGVKSPQNIHHIRKNLQSIFAYNFKFSLSEHANCQRPGYALGDEAGLLLCTWPKGGKPIFPFVYSDEVWTGIEYQVASHLIMEGFVDEGFTIVYAVRNRYDGHKRNPWNEYECGSYYARAMSSYALLSAISGFWYSMPDRCLTLRPKIDSSNFKIFFSTASGWGTIKLENNRKIVIEVIEGKLIIDTIEIEIDGKIIRLNPHMIANHKEKTIISIS